MWDVTENAYMNIEINILVTVVLYYPNYIKPKLIGISVRQACWHMAAILTENSTKIHCSKVKKNMVRSMIYFVT